MAFGCAAHIKARLRSIEPAALMTSTIVDAPLIRITVEPNEQNGLDMRSQIEVDKIFTIRREKIGAEIGQINDETMVTVNRALLVFLGLA
jgi:mRNA interferase MazF